MKPEDFYKLHIGQKILWNGVQKIIEALHMSAFGPRLVFCEDARGISWDMICADCSLEPPKEKKRYWLWSFDSGGGWYKHGTYFNENGENTEGAILFNDWENRKKIKHENEFIEV